MGRRNSDRATRLQLRLVEVLFGLVNVAYGVWMMVSVSDGGWGWLVAKWVPAWVCGIVWMAFGIGQLLGCGLMTSRPRQGLYLRHIMSFVSSLLWLASWPVILAEPLMLASVTMPLVAMVGCIVYLRLPPLRTAGM